MTQSQKDHPLYNTWHAMKRRCYDPSFHKYPWYGARGIEVAADWRDDFWTFVEQIELDIGPRPTEFHTLDREDNDGHYERGNVRWATYAEQARDRVKHRATFKGQTKSVAQWCRDLMVSDKPVMKNIRKGVAPEMALALALANQHIWKTMPEPDYSLAPALAEAWLAKQR